MFRIKFCREIILKLLYQIDSTAWAESEINDWMDIHGAIFKGLRDEEEEFVLKMVRTVMQEKEAIDKKICDHLIGWRLERLNPIDRSILRMGIAESSFTSQKAIIIDDHIRIAKKYGDKDSYKMINAILDRAIQ